MDDHQQRTGTVSRRALRSPKPSGSRQTWVVLVAAIVVTLLGAAWIVGASGPGAPAVEPSPSATGETPTDPATDEPTAPPTADPTDEPTVEPTAEPTLEATAQPTADATSEPPARTLIVEFPVDGGILDQRVIDAVGRAPPGSTITRDIPFWFDQHVVTGESGFWEMPIELAVGENTLTFRIGDDAATARTIRVTYRP